MIQRIQTLYLIMTTVLPLIFLKLQLLKFNGEDGSGYYLAFKGLYLSMKDHGSNLIKHLWLLSGLLLLIPAISLVTIFLFSKRKFQMYLVLVIIILSAGLIFSEIIYSVLIIREFRAQIIPRIMSAVPVLILIFSVLAYNGIRKDENLVRSYDRIR